MKLLDQFKQRRLSLKLRQSDIYKRTGLSRQQYQRIEKHGNPRLDTLERIAAGMSGEIMFIPREYAQEIRSIIDGTREQNRLAEETFEAYRMNPWKDFLEGVE